MQSNSKDIVKKVYNKLDGKYPLEVLQTVNDIIFDKVDDFIRSSKTNYLGIRIQDIGIFYFKKEKTLHQLDVYNKFLKKYPNTVYADPKYMKKMEDIKKLYFEKIKERYEEKVEKFGKESHDNFLLDKKQKEIQRKKEYKLKQLDKLHRSRVSSIQGISW